jgi:hypothetical protein
MPFNFPTDLPTDTKYWLQFAHPLLMWVLFTLTIYALYLGWQVRRTRSAQGETKTNLIKGKFNQKHHQIGAFLLAFMVLGTVGAMGVSYLNNGKLFVEAHLLVGLSMTTLMAFSASLTPFMQKGQDWARNTHIFLNIAITGLFGWQALTGMEIVQKILTQVPAP